MPQDTNQYTPVNFCLIPTKFPTLQPVIDSELYETFDDDTLLFIFFFQNDSKARYLVGKLLSKRDWMFNTKYSTWFKLIGEPKSVNDEYKEGKFKYFDFEKEWAWLTKKDYKFEWKQLLTFD